MSTFAEILYKERKKRKLDQKEMAVILGISPRMYQYYESGEFIPKQKKQIEFVNLLKLTNESQSNVIPLVNAETRIQLLEMAVLRLEKEVLELRVNR
jgi:transcriptional regulator with XRE-family HTH domain